MSILDEPIKPTPPNMFIARISGPLEKFAVVAILIGMLFKLQSWPYASELLLTGAAGLALSYLVLLPIRLFALKPILPLKDFRYALATGISLGVLVGSTSLMIALSLFAIQPTLIYILYNLRTIGLIGVVSTFIYDFIRTHPAPNTAEHMIALWLRKRQTIIMVLIVIGLFFRFLR